MIDSRRLLVGPALAGLIATAGCMTVGPDFVRPEVQLSPQWLAAGPTV